MQSWSSPNQMALHIISFMYSKLL